MSANDIIGRMDQAVEDSKQAARPIVAFYKALIGGGVNPVLASNITTMYAAKLLGPKTGGA